MSRLWIVRHGNTFEPGETPRRIGARTDLPLVASGHEQARALAAWFAGDGIRFDRVLAAPLRRTRETAAAIAGAAAIETADFLAEIDHGPDEDRPEPEVIARIGADAIEAWDRAAVAPPGWQVDAAARIAGWRKLLAGIGADETVLAVTSNGTARFALHAGVEDVSRVLKLRTGAWGLLVREAGGRWRVRDWDRRP